MIHLCPKCKGTVFPEYPIASPNCGVFAFKCVCVNCGQVSVSGNILGTKVMMNSETLPDALTIVMKAYAITDHHGTFRNKVFESEERAKAYCDEYNKKVKYPTLGELIGYEEVYVE